MHQVGGAMNGTVRGIMRTLISMYTSDCSTDYSAIIMDITILGAAGVGAGIK